MLLRASIAMLAVALSPLTGTPKAHADEAYVCDAGRVVYVRPGELEAMKRSDPCIAGYYGITLAPPAAVPAAGAVSAPPVELKTLADPENQASLEQPSNVRVALAGAGEITHRAAPTAAPGTDFRNVRLINGGADSNGWYRHTQ